MAGPAGHGRDQPSRRKVATPDGGSEKASASISQQREALWPRAVRVCFCVQRAGSSGEGSFRCGAESLIHLRRMLCNVRKDGGDGASLTAG